MLGKWSESSQQGCKIKTKINNRNLTPEISKEFHYMIEAVAYQLYTTLPHNWGSEMTGRF